MFCSSIRIQFCKFTFLFIKSKECLGESLANFIANWLATALKLNVAACGRNIML